MVPSSRCIPKRMILLHMLNDSSDMKICLTGVGSEGIREGRDEEKVRLVRVVGEVGRGHKLVKELHMRVI